MNKCNKPKRHKVCRPRCKLPSILSKKLLGLHDSVQKGMDTVSPKLYN